MNDIRLKSMEPFWGVWHLKKKLGEGGFGSVYEIERNDFGNTFYAAMKVLSIPRNESEYKEILADGMSQKEVTEYFREMVFEMTKEFALMETVKGHTNIVDYADHLVLEREDGSGYDIFIRMELLTPLNDYVMEHPLETTDVMHLAVDMCRALEVCEKSNIIHRDIKPANIFVSKSGDFKLGDFGIARVSEKTRGASTKVGTKTYLAPEVYKGEKYGKTVDVYSLGLVIYRFLNHGRLPFYPPFPKAITFSEKESALAKRMMGTEPLPSPDCDNEELVRIVKKACAYAPEDRYQSAKQMRMELEALLLQKEMPAMLGKSVKPKTTPKEDVKPIQFERQVNDEDSTSTGLTVGMYEAPTPKNKSVASPPKQEQIYSRPGQQSRSTSGQITYPHKPIENTTVLQNGQRKTQGTGTEHKQSGEQRQASKETKPRMSPGIEEVVRQYKQTREENQKKFEQGKQVQALPQVKPETVKAVQQTKDEKYEQLLSEMNQRDWGEDAGEGERFQQILDELNKWNQEIDDDRRKNQPEEKIEKISFAHRRKYKWYEDD